MNPNDSKRERANLAVRKARERKNQKIEYQKQELDLAKQEQDRLTKKMKTFSEVKSKLVEELLVQKGLNRRENFQLLHDRISESVKDTSQLQQTIFNTLAQLDELPVGTQQIDSDHSTPSQCSNARTVYEERESSLNQITGQQSYYNFLLSSSYVKTSVEAEPNSNFYQVNSEPNSTFERAEYSTNQAQDQAYTVDDVVILDEVLTTNAYDQIESNCQNNKGDVSQQNMKMIIRQIEENLKMSTQLNVNDSGDKVLSASCSVSTDFDNVSSNLDDIDSFIVQTFNPTICTRNTNILWNEQIENQYSYMDVF